MSPQERQSLARYAYGAATVTHSADKTLLQSYVPTGGQSERQRPAPPSTRNGLERHTGLSHGHCQLPCNIGSNGNGQI